MRYSAMFYIAGVLGTLRGISLFLATVAFCLTAVSVILTLSDWDDMDGACRKGRLEFIRYYATALIISAALAVGIPSRKTVYLMAGAEAVEAVLQDERTGQVTENALDAIDLWLERKREEYGGKE